MCPKKTACFLDFDHTLFNTDEFFHLDLRSRFLDLGIDRDCWEDSYAAIWHNGYSLEKHVAEIHKRSGTRIPAETIHHIFQEVCSDLTRYLFPDVFPSLDKLRRGGTRLYLLSFGNADWQRFKVAGSRLNGCFDALFFTAKEGSKAHLIAEKTGEFDRVVVVDNNPSELDRIKDVEPEAETYCINRVPADLVHPPDEITKLRFLEARQYLGKARRYRHIDCRALDSVQCLP